MLKNIAFYLGQNRQFPTDKVKNIMNGNPGIGGTQYMYFLIAYQIALRIGKDSVWLILDEGSSCETEYFQVLILNKNQNLPEACKQRGIFKVVINGNIVEKIKKEKGFDNALEYYIWGHNTITPRVVKLVKSLQCVKKYICVGKRQYENMVCYGCGCKAVYADNVITSRFYEMALQKSSDHGKPEAVYVGSIFPQKGLHDLLEIWRVVLEVNPDAVLYVIGSSEVWGISEGRTKLGVADKMYEKVLSAKLKKLSKPESVIFMKSMGWDLIPDVIKHCRVGIVNPSGFLRDETFCISAAELSAHAIPVVSRDRGDGLEYTVINGKTGYLKKRNFDIANAIGDLIASTGRSAALGEAARAYAGGFLPDPVVDKWISILDTPDFCESDLKSRSTVPMEIYCYLHDQILHGYYKVQRKLTR